MPNPKGAARVALERKFTGAPHPICRLTTLFKVDFDRDPSKS